MAKKNLTLEEKLNETIVKDGTYEVPGNWIQIFFGSILSIEGGTQPPKSQFVYESKDGYIRLYQIRDFSSEKYHTYVKNTIKLRVMSDGDIMLARYGASIGKIFMGRKGAYNVALAKLIYPNELYNTKFLYWYLKSDLFQNRLGDMSRTAVAGFNKNDLKDFIIPVPPLKEQQRIVDRIESLLEKLDKAKELIEEAREGFEKRKSAVLETAFSGELTEKWRIENKVAFKWNKYKFKDFILSIQAGKNFKCTERPANIDEVGLIKISAVTWGEFDQFENKVVEDKDKINENYFIKKGDYLISRANTLELVGSSVIVKNIDQRLMLSDKVWRVEFNNEIVSKELINYYVKSIKGREEIENRATGNQLSMRNISQDSFKDINVKLPEVREQQEIVRILDKLFFEESKIEELTQLEEQIELIKKSILAKAFRGELGTNCEEDESAFELLKEILSKE